MAATAVALAPSEADARVTQGRRRLRFAMTGARALVETLLAEGVTMRLRHPRRSGERALGRDEERAACRYLLVTHEFSAACMADGDARSTGRPGVLCVVPGPGVTNALTGIGEALLDSVPMVVHRRRRGPRRQVQAFPGPRTAASRPAPAR